MNQVTRFSPARGAAHIAVDRDWLALVEEDILEPALPIVDPHHHAWEKPVGRYLFGDIVEDVYSGHNIRATVFVEGGVMYRSGGPEELRPLGQTEFANGLAAMSASGQYGPTRICEGIVGHVDLRLGAKARTLLERHIAVTDGRLRGIRHVTAWHHSADVRNPLLTTHAGIMGEDGFRAGFRELAAMNLSFDAWVYHPQIDEVAGLARANPDVTIVLNHVGGLIGIGDYSRDRDGAFTEWEAAIRRIAEVPNVNVKLGGLGMRLGGYLFHERDRPPGSEELARLWRPAIETCIGAFGPSRCMFESNFPVDKGSCSYHVLWNAFKRITAGHSPADKAQLFSETARRVYRLQQD